MIGSVQDSTLSNVLLDFEDGDLLYGLVESRRPYVTELELKRPELESPPIVDYMVPKIVRGPGIRGYPSYRGHRGGNSPAGSLGAFVERHAAYSPFLRPLPTAEDYFTRKRRVCKAGILFALERGHRVHFILDHLDMERVVYKSGDDDKSENFEGAKHRGYTGAELRSIYRMRHDTELVTRILFWKNDQCVAPPWETQRELWAQYQPGPESES